MVTKAEIAAELFNIGAVKFGEFTLKSGMKSLYYIQLRHLTSYPDLLLKVGKLLGELIKENIPDVDKLVGVAYAGIPLVIATSIATGIPACYTRKEVKEYGISNLIEGELRDGENVVVVDDLITDGQSKIETIEKMKNSGVKFNIKGVAVLLDREQGGKEILEKHGISLFSAMSITEVARWLNEKGLLGDADYKSILEYTKNYSKQQAL